MAFGIKTCVFLCTILFFTSLSVCAFTATGLVVASCGYHEFNIYTGGISFLSTHILSLTVAVLVNHISPHKMAQLITALNVSFNIFNYFFSVLGICVEHFLVHGPWSTGPCGFIFYVLLRVVFLVLYAPLVDAQQIMRTFCFVMAGHSAVSFAIKDHVAAYTYAGSCVFSHIIHFTLSHGYGALQIRGDQVAGGAGNGDQVAGGAGNGDQAAVGAGAGAQVVNDAV